MTSRSSFASKRRPLSAIFLGDGPAASSTSSTSELPDLPEPPSPGAASTNSGLPSPPATNSTGSGSTGDRREAVDLHSIPPHSSTLTMRHERSSTSSSSRASSPAGNGEYRREEGDDEEDTTARLDLGRRRGASQSNDHEVTLQRVMSLTQRNRMVCTVLRPAHEVTLMMFLPLISLPFIIRHSATAYRPSTNSHRCASTLHLHPSRLDPHVLLDSRVALQHQVLQRRLLSATALGQWSPRHYPARRQSASPVQPIPPHQMTSQLHLLHPSRMHILS